MIAGNAELSEPFCSRCVRTVTHAKTTQSDTRIEVCACRYSRLGSSKGMTLSISAINSL